MISLTWPRRRRTGAPAPPAGPAPDPDRPASLSAAEVAVLKYIARRGATGPERVHAGRLADGMRTSYPELDDTQIAQVVLRCRQILLVRHDHGLNLPQIARLLGLVATELTALERETSQR